MERSSEFRQLLIGISTMRYLPPSGTAGLARSFVNGNKRVPAPPPIMMASVLWVVPGGNAPNASALGFFGGDSRCGWCCIVYQSITQRLLFCGNFFAIELKRCRRLEFFTK